MNNNSYNKFRVKLVKLCNFETPSPNVDAPSSPIPLKLINFNFIFHFNIQDNNKLNNSKTKIFYKKFIFNLIRFCNFEIPSPNFAAP